MNIVTIVLSIIVLWVAAPYIMTFIDAVKDYFDGK